MKNNLTIYIQKCYPGATILDVAETFYPNKGWLNTEKTCTPYTSIRDVETKLKLRIAGGATHFNFKIEDQFEQIRFADYTVQELLKAKCFV